VLDEHVIAGADGRAVEIYLSEAVHALEYKLRAAALGVVHGEAGEVEHVRLLELAQIGDVHAWNGSPMRPFACRSSSKLPGTVHCSTCSPSSTSWSEPQGAGSIGLIGPRKRPVPTEVDIWLMLEEIHFTCPSALYVTASLYARRLPVNRIGHQSAVRSGRGSWVITLASRQSLIISIFRSRCGDSPRGCRTRPGRRAGRRAPLPPCHGRRTLCAFGCGPW